MRRKVLACFVAFTTFLTLLANVTFAQTADDALVVWYKLNETTGTNVQDASGKGRNGTLNGGAVWLEGKGVQLDGTDDYIKMPDGILSGLTETTIMIDAYVDASNANPSWLFTFGSAQDPVATDQSKYLGLLLKDDLHRAVISNDRWENEHNIIVNSPITKGEWKSYAITIKNKMGAIFENGVCITTDSAMTLDPQDVENTIANYIGKPPYPGDKHLKGKIKDFRIYNRALESSEIEQILLETDYESLDLGNLSAVTSNLSLPSKGYNGSVITWQSDDLSYLTESGVITRPTSGNPDRTVHLTATIQLGSQPIQTKDFTVNIPAEYSDQQKADETVNKITLVNTDDIRGNITLPDKTEEGVPITWISDKEDVISTQAVSAASNNNYAPIPGGVVHRQVSGDTAVKLTATVNINGAQATKEFNVTVKKAPAPITEADYKGYLFNYFAGQSTAMGEQIYFALSQDGLNWKNLNYSEPVLTTHVGEKGVRDPFILRSPEGDKFYMIATDLSIYNNGDWGRAQTAASKSIVIWESTDLVNWSNERLVKIARDDAGCTWAPEAVYDDKTGEYLVFWASRVAEDNYAKQRIYICKTRDFYTFTKPEVYVDRAADVIDSTMIKYNGMYYRFSKDEVNKNINIDKCDQLLNKTFEMVPSPSVGAEPGVEGPAIFKFNGENKWCLLLDNYGSTGYYPLVSDDIASGVFKKLTASEYKMPAGPRHGTVMPITQAEYDALQQKWGASALPTEDVKQEPIMTYNFDETLSADKSAADTSGYNRNGALKGNAIYKQDAEKNSQVLYLDGTSGTYMEFPESFFDGRDTMTISMDIKSEMSGGNFFTFALGKDNSRYMFLKILPTNIKNAMTIGSYSSEKTVSATTESTQNKWMNIKIVLEPGKMKVYKDGNLIGENQATGLSVSDIGRTLKGYLGKSFYSGDGYFKGSFDNIQIYNRALSELEIKGIVPGSKDELSELITLHAAKTAEDYTAESFAAFETAYNEAKNVQGDSAATAEAIANAITQLKDAVSKLVFKPSVNEGTMVLHYGFDDISSGIIKDSSGKNNDGKIVGNGAVVENGTLTLPGGSGVNGAYVELPKGMFDKKNSLTITAWLKNDTGKGNFAAMFFGTTENYPAQYWLFNPCDPSGLFKSVITNGNDAGAPWSTESGISPTSADRGVAGPLTDNNWAFYTTVIGPNSITAYYNGTKIGTVNTTRTVTDFGQNLVAYIGKSSYSDPYFKGALKDVKVYAGALSETAVKDEMAKTFFVEEKQNLQLAETMLVNDISLPTVGATGSKITWKSSDTNYITDNGKVTRPVQGQPDVQVTLTATIEKYGLSETKDFVVTVLAQSDSNDVQKDIENLSKRMDMFKVLSQDIRLPETEKLGSKITWQTSNPAVIDITGKIHRPQKGSGNVTVTLTATIEKGAAKQTKAFNIAVMEEYSAYIMSYFGSWGSEESDSLHLAYSYDGLKWYALNGNNGVLFPTTGTKHIRDPYLFRKQDGKFVVLATNNWSSPDMYVWDSENLTNYTNERLVTMNTRNEHTWAPEASFDSERGEYVVYWSGNAIYANTTKDFTQVSKDVEFFNPGYSVIDANIVKDEGNYYMFFKDEREPYGTYKKIKMAKSTSLTPGSFQVVTPEFITDKNSEGPAAIKSLTEDKWYLYYDYFLDGGKWGCSASTDLDSNNWTKLSDTEFNLPSNVRHGNAVGVTESELKALQAKWGANEPITLSAVKDKNIAVTTLVGQEPKLPSKVQVSYSNGVQDSINVAWDSIDAAKYQNTGSFEVTGTIKENPYADFKITDRADPYVYKHTDGYYYFTASYTDPANNNVSQYQYTKLVLRRAKTINELPAAEEKVIYSKAPIGGTESPHIWAPEIHFINGKWYIYYTTTISATDKWQIRPHVLECADADPTTGTWIEKGQVQKASSSDLAFNGFSLDHTTFEHNGKRYMIWAQNNPNSNLYIAEMSNPWTLSSNSVLLTKPEYNWETHGYKVNEGPAVLKKNGKIFIAYSASGTDALYCLGLLTASDTSNLLDPVSWSKSVHPVLISSTENKIYGPGHNSFTVSEDGTEDIMIYHGRPEEKYISSSYEPLYDSGRHAYAQKVFWNADGTPSFGVPKGNDPGQTITIKATVQVTRASSGGSGSSGSGSTTTPIPAPIVPAPVVPAPVVPAPAVPVQVIKVNISTANGAATIDGKKVQMTVKPYVQDGRTIVGLRDTAKLLQVDNKDIIWNEKAKTIVIKTKDKKIELFLNQKVAVVNGKKVVLDVAPQLKNGSTVLPVGHIARLMNINIQFNTITKDSTFVITK